MAGSAGTALWHALRAGGEPGDGALGSGVLAGGVRRHGGAGRERSGRKGLPGAARGGVLSGGRVRARLLAHARVAAGGSLVRLVAAGRGLVRGVSAGGRLHRRLAAGWGPVRRELAAGALRRLSGVHGRLLAAGALLGLPRTMRGLAACGRARLAAGVAGHALGQPALAVLRVLGTLRAARGLGRGLRAARSAVEVLTDAAGVAVLLPALAVRRYLGAARLRGGVVLLVRGMLVGRGRAMCLLWPRCGMLALGMGGR
ncbi:hypothetical protein [Nocardiopsis sp. HUAS JQ3]|uniref:hypothetical protein n=1 Tax=Nocardiopsis sp. HUAS JQ3 TaxID=3061629 RepID=UPI0023A93A99|nr:hypothetical protein [Nocardiopsis sp. HUAS JQ3]WDZ91687.1 hypothetical protein PV789_03735 [Nocardiopsis sp. HUAS JQ3]